MDLDKIVTQLVEVRFEELLQSLVYDEVGSRYSSGSTVNALLQNKIKAIIEGLIEDKDTLIRESVVNAVSNRLDSLRVGWNIEFSNKEV